MHTPLPWEAEDVYITTERGDRGDYMFIAKTSLLHTSQAHIPECEANARFIVRACNSHANLLEALVDLVDAEDHVPWDDYSEEAHYHNIEAAVIRARQAIEKAK